MTVGRDHPCSPTDQQEKGDSSLPWINVRKTLPDGFGYRDVIIGADGRPQPPSWLVVAHRS